MNKATIEIECRGEQHLHTIMEILCSLEDVHVREGYCHLKDANLPVKEGEKE